MCTAALRQGASGAGEVSGTPTTLRRFRSPGAPSGGRKARRSEGGGRGPGKDPSAEGGPGAAQSFALDPGAVGDGPASSFLGKAAEPDEARQGREGDGAFREGRAGGPRGQPGAQRGGRVGGRWSLSSAVGGRGRGGAKVKGKGAVLRRKMKDSVNFTVTGKRRKGRPESRRRGLESHGTSSSSLFLLPPSENERGLRP